MNVEVEAGGNARLLLIALPSTLGTINIAIISMVDPKTRHIVTKTIEFRILALSALLDRIIHSIISVFDLLLVSVLANALGLWGSDQMTPLIWLIMFNARSGLITGSRRCSPRLACVERTTAGSQV